MEEKRKQFKDNFKLRNISDLDVVLLGIGIFVWFIIVRTLNPQLEQVENQTAQVTSPFVSYMFILVFLGYILLIGLRIGYKKGKEHLLQDLKKEGRIKN